MGPSPVDRARPGSKHHLLVDATGIPLAWTVTGGNRNDVAQLVPLLERIPPVRGRSADRAAGLSASPLIGGMITTSTGASSAGAGSRRRSHAARPSTAPGSAAPAGSSSASSPGCATSSGSSSATTAATRSMKPSSLSAAASSASPDSATHCDSSSNSAIVDAAVLAVERPLPSRSPRRWPLHGASAGRGRMGAGRRRPTRPAQPGRSSGPTLGS